MFICELRKIYAAAPVWAGSELPLARWTADFHGTVEKEEPFVVFLAAFAAFRDGKLVNELCGLRAGEERVANCTSIGILSLSAR